MWNEPSKKRLSEVPKLYQTEEIPLKEKLIYLHFFINNTDFYIVEYDGEATLWGFVILNGDYEMAEWGYVNYEELKSIKVNGWQEVDYDQHWQIRPTKQVEKICSAQGWQFTKPAIGIEIECPVCKKVIVSDSKSKEIKCSACKTIILQKFINSIESKHKGENQWHTLLN